MFIGIVFFFLCVGWGGGGGVLVVGNDKRDKCIAFFSLLFPSSRQVILPIKMCITKDSSPNG
jgi:hypothetical protein